MATDATTGHRSTCRRYGCQFTTERGKTTQGDRAYLEYDYHRLRVPNRETKLARHVAVLGTGAAGLTAALAAAEAGARVSLFEKADTVGGTTALSGGACWVPNNRHTLALHGEDSRERALEYLNSLSFGLIDSDLLETLVDTGPEVIDWLEKQTSIQFSAVDGYPDYHPDRPGAAPHGGRTLDPGLFPFRELGEWADRVTPSGRLDALTLSDTGLGGGTGQLAPAVLAERQAADLRGCGLSLVAHLLKACLDIGVEPQTQMRAIDLQFNDGWVVEFEGGKSVSVDAVVIATGGFEWNPDLVRSFLRGPMTAPASLSTCTGDGLLMAMRAGAMLGNMREAWWIPCSDIPGPDGVRPRPYLINRERTLPDQSWSTVGGNASPTKRPITTLSADLYTCLTRMNFDM
jgi:3-oxosteroid 1-dehydrogenase